MPNAVYQLKPILDDPMFDSLIFDVGVGSLTGRFDRYQDLKPIQNSKGIWVIPSLKKKWELHVPVKGAVRTFNDYPCIGLSHPAFSARAVNALKVFLEKNGELLPVHHKNGTYFVFNLRRISNVLLELDSEIKRMPSGNVDCISKYAFDPSSLERESIFRIEQKPFGIHVTEKFRVRVLDCGLNGFNFIKVWPLPKNADWRNLETLARKKRSKELVLRGETVILRFRLLNDTANQAEKTKLRRYEGELVDLLSSQQSVDDAYFGSLDASEAKSGVHNLFLSCPSADKLVDFLHEWIQSVDWKVEFHLVKRAGHMMDRKATEVRIVIQ